MAFRKPKKAGRFEYKPASKKFMQKHIASRGRDFDSMFKIDVPSFKARDGENKIRLIPRTSDEMDYWAFPVNVHYGVGPDEQTYVCPRKHGGGKCPICEEYERARRANKEEDAKELRPNTRYLSYLIDRKDSEKGIQVWAMPGKLDGELSKQTIDPETNETLNIDNPESGYDVYFTREGQGIKTNYAGVKLARKESELDDTAALRFAQKHPLPDILQVYDYDHLLKEFEGSTPSDETSEDEDEDERPRKKKSARDEDEDEDEDEDVPFEEDEDEDEDEEEKPRKKKRAADEDDDDAEDDDEDDDDDDDAEEDEDEDESESELTAADLRKMNLVKLKALAQENEVDWKKLRILAKKQAWDGTKLKIRLRAKIAEALDIEL